MFHHQRTGDFTFCTFCTYGALFQGADPRSQEQLCRLLVPIFSLRFLMHGGVNEMQKFTPLPVLQHWTLKSAQHFLSILLKCTAFTKKVHKVQKVEKVAKSAHVNWCALQCNGVFIKKLFVIFCAHSTKCAQSAHSAQLFFLMWSFVHLKCIKFRAWVTDPHASSQDNDQACGDLDATTCLPLP